MILYNIIGCKRSGHHAIMFWLMCQKRSETHYLGDAKYPHTMVDDLDYQESPNSIVITSGNLESIYFNELLHKKIDKEIVINTENHPQCTLSENKKMFPNNDFFNKDSIKHIIVIRDIYNTIASVLRMMPNMLQLVNDDWITHAKEYLEQTNILNDKYFILYNKWFKDDEYREQICIDLGLYHTDIGLNQVPHNGCGSSFSGMSFDGKAQNMKVDQRYKQVEQHILNKSIKDINKELNNLIF